MCWLLPAKTLAYWLAMNGTLIKEVVGDSPRQEVHDELAFPIKNTTLPTGSKSDRTGSSDDHSYLKRVYESCG